LLGEVVDGVQVVTGDLADESFVHHLVDGADRAFLAPAGIPEQPR
jgi:uncharacterized protein YbjT (DUF2867 family)